MQAVNKDTSYTGWQVYKRLFVYVRPYWAAFLLSFVGFSLYALSQTAFAKWLEYLVDSFGKGNAELQNREFVALAIIAIFVIRGIGTFIGQYSIAYAGRKVIHALRIDLFRKLLHLPCDFYHKESSGQILSKLTYNVEQVTGAATGAIRVIIREGLTVLGLLIYLFYLNWLLTLVFLGVGPLIVAVVAYASKRFRMLSKNIQNSVGDVAHSTSEAINGHEVVRIFQGQKRELNRFTKASEYNRQQFMKMVVAQSINTPIVQLIVATSLSLLVYLATSPQLLADMSTGEFIAFITAAGMIAKPLRQLTEVNSIIQKGLAAAISIFELNDLPSESDQGSRKIERLNGKIELKNVSFAYSENQLPVLSNLNLAIEPGQKIALVGKSGSGKTTLSKLIPRFYNPQSGSILVDGIDLQEIPLAELRKNISLVNQNITLFEGSIADNIAYGGLSESSRDAIDAAAQAAHVDEFTDQFPEGLDTIIGENGVMLSGGQRQRIAIARAILKDAPILILDEATSALDSESENHIQAALEEVMKGKTTIIIAHRLSTIENTDVIAVLLDGKIIEQGNHSELLGLKGAYSELHNLQFKIGE